MISADEQPIIGFYSAFDDPKIWENCIKEQLPKFRFEVLDRTLNRHLVKYAIVWSPPKGLLCEFPGLEAIFVIGAGVDSLLQDPDIPDVPIFRLTDAGMAYQMAHYVIYGVLHFQRKFSEYQQSQSVSEWQPITDIVPPANFGVGVLGLGAIGSVIASEITRLGFSTKGWSTSIKKIKNVDTFCGDEGLDHVLQSSRVLVNVLPLTKDTKEIFSKDLFARLRPGTFLINIGRGQHVNEADLLSAIDANIVLGAMLDVFSVEPLPSSSLLWTNPRVLITPHTSGLTVPEEAMSQIISNIKLAERQQIPLGEVDRGRGY